MGAGDDGGPRWLVDLAGSDTARRCGGGRGLLVAIVQLAIAAGAIVGGLAFDLSGYRATFELSVVVLIVAAALAWLASYSASRESMLESSATA